MTADADPARLRMLLLSRAPLRRSAQAVVETLLLELAPLDADTPAPAWAHDDGEPFWPEWAAEFTVGELRDRLRVMLEDLATAEHLLDPDAAPEQQS